MSVTVTQQLTQQTVTVTGNPVENNVVVTVSNARGPAGDSGGGGASAWDDLTGTASDVPFEPITAPAYSEGLVFYDSTDKSLTYYNDEADVSMNIGRELWVRVRNDSGSAILNGKVVYINDAVGQLPTIRLARADSATTSRVIGIATHDIGNNEFGYVTTVGEVKGLNTSDFQDGDLLFLSATTAGDMTTTAPLAPNRVIQVATVLHAHITQGKLYCHPETDSIPSTGIVDSTSTGRSLITAASASAARTTLELGTLATQSATITDYLTIASASDTYAAKGANTDITKLTGIAAGTVSAPFLTWGDANSGFYGYDSKSIGYCFDGVEKFRFDTSGFIVSSAGGAATRSFAIVDAGSQTFNAGLTGSNTQCFGFGDLLSTTLGRFERSTSTGLISFTMQGVASASTTFNIGHQDASFRIRGAASQSAALQEWRNSSEAVLASINSDGSASVKGLTTAGPVSLLKSGSSDLFSFDFLNVYFAPGSALEFRTKLGSGATGDALFQAASVKAANETLLRTTKLKTTQTDRNSSGTGTTYTTDSDFTVPVSAGKTYRVEFALYTTATNTGTAGGGFKGQFTIPSVPANLAGATSQGVGMTTNPGGTLVNLAMTTVGVIGATAITRGAASINGTYHGFFEVTIGTTGGNLLFQWAQSSSSADNTSVLANSSVTVIERTP